MENKQEGWLADEAQALAESIYQSWKAGDTAADRWNWFMVRLTEEDQKMLAERYNREIGMDVAR